MASRRSLGEFEQLVLFALVDLGDQAYGLTVKRCIEERTGRQVTVGAVYTALDRLESRGLVSTTVEAPTARRGGRRRKHYWLEAAGAEALRASFTAMHEMSKGLVHRLDKYVR